MQTDSLISNKIITSSNWLFHFGWTLQKPEWYQMNGAAAGRALEDSEVQFRLRNKTQRSMEMEVTASVVDSQVWVWKVRVSY